MSKFDNIFKTLMNEYGAEASALDTKVKKAKDVYAKTKVKSAKAITSPDGSDDSEALEGEVGAEAQLADATSKAAKVKAKTLQKKVQQMQRGA